MISFIIRLVIAGLLIWHWRADNDILILAGVLVLEVVVNLMCKIPSTWAPDPQGIGQAPPFRPDRPPPSQDLPFPGVGHAVPPRRPPMEDEKFTTK